MFNIKVFPDFVSNQLDDEKERKLLKELCAIKKGIKARYVNVSYYDYNGSDYEAVHYLTYPLNWISHYVTNFFTDIDPLFKIDYRSVNRIDWQEIYQGKERARILRNFSEHGLGQNGITLVEHVERDLYCVLSASFDISDNDWQKFKRDHIEVMRFQANKIGEIYNQLFRIGTRQDYAITPREAECLYWVAMGKTDDQISNLLNIGKWTVNGHLQNAKLKLDSPSRSAAVAQAIVLGIITVKQAI